MTTLSRVRIAWTGFPGAPGVTTLYSTATIPNLAAIRTAFAAFAAAMPNTVHGAVESAGDIIEDTTGDLVGAWSSSSVTGFDGTVVGGYAGPAGAVISWRTSTILDGHRLKGRSFIVPLSANQYQSDGSLVSTEQASLQSAATAMVTAMSSELAVWHRPFPGREATPTRPAKAAHDGGHGLVTSAVVPDLAAVLRSRRANV